MQTNCKNCGQSFPSVKRGNQIKKYCSILCRRTYWKNKEKESKLQIESIDEGNQKSDDITKEIGKSLLNRGLKPAMTSLITSSGLGAVGIIGGGIISDVAAPKIKEGIQNGTIRPIGTVLGVTTGLYISRNQPWYIKLLSMLFGGTVGNATDHIVTNILRPMPKLPLLAAADGGGGGGENKVMNEIIRGYNNLVDNDKTAEEILNTRYKSYNMKTDYFGLIFGYKPADPFHAVAYGKPGSGKSTLSMKYANYFSNKFGKVKFLSSEMKEGNGLKNLLLRTNTKGDNIVFDTAPSNMSLEQHIEKLKSANAKLLIVDSANHLKWSPDDLEQIKKAVPNLSTFVILQSVKQGDFRGHNDYVHNADVVLKIQGFEVFTEKSRFDKEPLASVAINL